ncbi:MAG: S8 family serine peptidase [Promethearchaeia archaeon]
MRSFSLVKQRKKKILTLFFLIVLISTSFLSLLCENHRKNGNSLTPNIFSGNTGENNLLDQYNAQDLISANNSQYPINYTGNNVTVAVLDTGIRAEHNAFTDAGRINWSERIQEFWDEKEDGVTDDPEDIYWHGTWTASILGGNGTDYQGVAPDVNFIIMQVFKYNEDDEIVSDPDIVERAVNWLIENKEKYNIRIVSMSFGAEINSGNQDEVERLHEMVDDLFFQDILVVASAGNYGAEGSGTITSPASAKSALAVGGLDEEGNIYPKSGRGPTNEGVIKPDVCAPAVSILGASKEGSLEEYISRSGTSASTPMVAGLAALMLEKNDELTSKDLKSIISMTSIRTEEQQTLKDNAQGWGRVNGYAALRALETPTRITQNFDLEFHLNHEIGVLCLPLTVPPDQYFLQLDSLDSLKAEMFLFARESDSYGNPQLVTDTLSLLTQSSSQQRMGFFTEKDQSYYLVVKALLNSGTEGTFKISLVFDERAVLIVILFGLNLISLIYIIRKRVNPSYLNKK